MVLTLSRSCSFSASNMLLGFTLFFVMSATPVFSAGLRRQGNGWPMRVIALSWLCLPHITISINPSLAWGLPVSLKGHSHFLVHVTSSLSYFLYSLYFPLLSHPRGHKFSPIPACTTLIWSISNNNKSNSLSNFLSLMYQILPSMKNLKYDTNNIINNKIH
jgi:hypothetical protein